MSLLRRILITVVIAFVVLFAGGYWIAPIALSFYAARKAPAIVTVMPTDLKDHSVSPAPGMKLAYLGYEFEVPWSDLDQSKTVLYPKDKPNKTRVVLAFKSGLRLMVTAVQHDSLPTNSPQISKCRRRNSRLSLETERRRQTMSL